MSEVRLFFFTDSKRHCQNRICDYRNLQNFLKTSRRFVSDHTIPHQKYRSREAILLMFNNIFCLLTEYPIWSYLRQADPSMKYRSACFKPRFVNRVLSYDFLFSRITSAKLLKKDSEKIKYQNGKRNHILGKYEIRENRIFEKI